MAKQIKIGLAGNMITFPVSENTTIRDLVQMYSEETEISMETINTYELRYDGESVHDLDMIPEDGKLISFSKNLEGNNEQAETTEDPFGSSPTAAAPDTPAKKKDLFTKEFCENASLEVVQSELIKWALDQKIKNKYLQPLKKFLLGEIATFPIGDKSYELEVIQRGNKFAIVTKEGVDVFGGKKLDVVEGQEGESAEDLIREYNSRAFANMRNK